MQMNDENIQTEEVKRAAEPEYKIPEDATDNSRPNETAEVVTRESAEETNTELLQSIDKKLDMLLARVISFEAFSMMVDEALERMKKMLESNKAMQTLVSGEAGEVNE